ncbi:CBS domain-containing protein [Staphylococcus shinii]|jgi:CBS domain-containing protein|uniref:CBS domain-containing protein n=1 Tax=Staphylococcus shinii TaxID=2912228 RepID=UPI00298EFB23|nr:CBS domain-containing protein [Staphylococcus shinii]MDW8569690.1 CBS domain-containing protein [Staphylococcus shinii]MDW8571730.1 CBS domain-containing protein [Staphylococcus shinii]
MSQVKDYITKNIETVNVEENLETLAKKMAKQDIGFLPVLDNGNYVGVITDRDIVIKGVAQSLNTAQQVMTKDVVTGYSEMETDEAVNLLQKHNIYRLLIVDDNKITGVVTLGDLGKENADQLIGKVVSTVSDSNSNN